MSEFERLQEGAVQGLHCDLGHCQSLIVFPSNDTWFWNGEAGVGGGAILVTLPRATQVTEEASCHFMTLGSAHRYMMAEVESRSYALRVAF